MLLFQNAHISLGVWGCPGLENQNTYMHLGSQEKPTRLFTIWALTFCTRVENKKKRQNLFARVCFEFHQPPRKQNKSV